MINETIRRSFPSIRNVLAIFPFALCAGCSIGSGTPTTISAAIAGVQADLTKAGVVSTSHAAEWSADQAARFEANVRALQCAQHTSDPVVAMISGPVTMNLTGSFTQSGSFSVSSLTTMPVFGIGADASRTRGQGLSLPVQFVPLGSLADAEMAREVEYAGALLAQNDEVRHDEGARIREDQDELTGRVQALIDTFSSLPCPKGKNARPFVGLHRS